MDERIVETTDEAEKDVHIYVFEVLTQTDGYRRNSWKSQRKQEIYFWTIKYFPDNRATAGWGKRFACLFGDL